MDFEGCKKKIDRYLAKDDVQPLIVDVQNQKDLNDIIIHYNVGSNKVIKAEDYCNKDELPRIDVLFHDWETKADTVFVTGLTSFLKLYGEKKLRKVLGEILSMFTSGHVIVVTYQCRKYLDFVDPRLRPRILVHDGEEQPVPEIFFLTPKLNHKGIQSSIGIDKLARAVESTSTDRLFVVTQKEKTDFQNALYRIMEIRSAYELLGLRDPKTSELNESIGTDELWEYALDLFEKNPKWISVIDSEFGSHKMLDMCIQSYKSMSENKCWLYFVGIKLFGTKNVYLNQMISSAESGDFIKNIYRNIFRGILDKNPNDADFWDCYECRKILLKQIGNPSVELTEYCKVVVCKGKKTIYYLTDNTVQEKEAIFAFLDQHGLEYKRDDLMEILKRVYPELFAYMQPFHFKNELLDQYFQDYKYQKIINKLLPEFEKKVLEQAEKREYNLILEPRSSKIERLNTTDSLLYFVDAMGVEYLGFIMSVCKNLQLKANVTVCRCELPSITSRNQEFLDLWNGKVVSIKDIDAIKHHGKFDYDYYSNSKLPLHLMKEMQIIYEILEKIKDKLIGGKIKSAVMIADHGASRLAVLHDTENIWEMAEKGKHSGRCCPKSNVDIQPDYATDADDFWALANYDRFKGGRKANVEVHGGATLEEICVPIIELTYSEGKIEVYLMAVDDDSANFKGIPEIEVSFRKKAAIKLFMTENLQDVSITVNGKNYEAVPLEKGFYRVDMPDLRKPGTYSVEVYSGANSVVDNLTFKVKREGLREKELL